MNSQHLFKLGIAMLLVFSMVGHARGQSAPRHTGSVTNDESMEVVQVANPSRGIRADGYCDDLETARKAPAKVVSLNLQGAMLTSIPADLGIFVNLKELDLSHNALKNLDGLAACPAGLKGLYLNHNQLIKLPASLARFSHLQVLEANANPIAEIDAAIGGLRELKHLELAGNGSLTSFQPAVWSLTGLETLRLWSFGMTEIPDAIAQMKQLKTLCLLDNDLVALNPKVCALPALEYLNLGKNNLAQLPLDIAQCTKLSYLGIFENPIAILPSNIIELSNHLAWFSAWDTGFSAAQQAEIKRNFSKTEAIFDKTNIH